MRRALWIAGLAATAGIALAVLAPAGEEPSLRPLMPRDAEVVREPELGYRVSLPAGWEQVRADLTPRLAPEGGTILAVATFRPRGGTCGPEPDLPDTAIPPRGTLLLVQEELDAQPGNLPRRPRFELR